jgi:hypothetical protein
MPSWPASPVVTAISNAVPVDKIRTMAEFLKRKTTRLRKAVRAPFGLGTWLQGLRLDGYARITLILHV